jgi:hypothetical protein
MATIDIGKIKQVWRGTYAGGTAYTPDDVVEYTDSGILSSYICIANTTGNNPSSSGTAHGSWNYLAKGGAAGTDLTSTLSARGDILYKGASNVERLPKGTAGYYLKQGANDPEWSAVSGGGILQVKNTQLLTSADYSGSSFGSITGLSVAITPSATANRLWIMVTVNGQHSTGGMNTMFRVRDVTNSQIAVGVGYDWYHDSGGGVSGNSNMQGFYTPPNTNAMTLQVEVAQMAGGTYKLNKAYNSDVNGQSAITIFEIASSIL